MPPARSQAALEQEIASLDWYHTLELTPTVVTPGWFDARGILDRVPIPASLAGKRCLDIGTFDGFWAFEMERRGAAEVIAIDILNPDDWDWPAGSDPATRAAVGQRKAGGSGFEIAREALDSRVERRELSAYDVGPGDVGTFDFIYLGSLLIHLRDPVRALERIRSVCGGRLVVVDNIDLTLSLRHPRRPVAAFDGLGRPWWWAVNEAGLKRLVEAAGFEVVEGPVRIYMPAGAGQPSPPLRPRVLCSREGRKLLLASRRGDPHAALAARPA